MTTDARALRSTVPALVLVGALVACGAGDASTGQPSASRKPTATASTLTQRSELPEPCPSGATLDLGRPFRGQQEAEFDTAGGEVFVTVRRFEEGGVLDPEVGRSAVFVGPASSSPSYDEQSGRVSGAVARVPVAEDTWSSVQLPPGRYWLWATNGSDVVVRSCEQGGVSGGAPAP